MNNIPDGFKLVPVEPTDDMIVSFAEAWYSKRQTIDDPDMADAYRDMLIAAPTPPQPIYDEAKERELFNAWYSELPTTKLKETMWMAWEACAQSRAKAGEDE